MKPLRPSETNPPMGARPRTELPPPPPITGSTKPTSADIQALTAAVRELAAAMRLAATR